MTSQEHIPERAHTDSVTVSPTVSLRLSSSRIGGGIKEILRPSRSAVRGR